jgi:hypothetical protein
MCALDADPEARFLDALGGDSDAACTIENQLVDACPSAGETMAVSE